LATDSFRCAIAHTLFFHHPFSQCACPILRATAIFYLSFVLKRAAQACAVPASSLAPTGDHRLSSRRRATINSLRADGRSSTIIAPTGDQHILLRRRAIIDHPLSSRRQAIFINHLADK
jgi:hypothetical protein